MPNNLKNEQVNNLTKSIEDSCCPQEAYYDSTNSMSKNLKDEKKLNSVRKTEHQESLYCPKGACHYLNISMAKLRSDIFKREITFVKLGRLIRFKKEDLDEYIQSQRVERKGI